MYMYVGKMRDPFLPPSNNTSVYIPAYHINTTLFTVHVQCLIVHVYTCIHMRIVSMNYMYKEGALYMYM